MFKKISGLGIPLFFVSPILGFLVSLFDLKSKSSAFIYIGFAMLFGFAISFTDTSSDSYRYAQAFKNFDNTLNFEKIVIMYQNGELRDLYRLVLFYFVAIFSNNPKIVYAFAGLVYGIFSYLSLKVFMNENEDKKDLYTFVLILVFYTYVTLTNINGFRFHTGSVLLFYSAYQFIILGKNRWVLGIIITPWFHYGFMLVVPLYVTYKYISYLFYNKNRTSYVLFYVFIGCFLASWFLKTNSINLSFLSQNEVLSGEVAERVNFINSSDTASLVEKRKEDSLFLGVQKYFEYGIKIFVLLSVLLIRRVIDLMEGDKTEYTKMFALVLFLYSFAFIATSIPSGGRFLAIAHLFLLLLLVKIYSLYKKSDIKKIILFAIPAFSFQIAFVNFMAPSMFLSSTFWYGNFFWILIEGI